MYDYDNIILVLEGHEKKKKTQARLKSLDVVIIAERIHLFPFRTQKLSSRALIVLDGKLSGRVGRSHVNVRLQFI